MQVLIDERLSKRVCKPCGRKIRKAHECFTFIRSNLDSPTAHAQTFDTLVSNQRFKRQLPSTITPERIRSQTIQKTSTASQKARKALDYAEIEIENETPNNDAIMFALNIDELCNTEKKETQLKTIIVHPNGNIETRLNFEECTKKIILNLIHGNLRAVANMVFKLPGISNFLRDVLRRTVASEFKVCCGDSSESMLRATSPNDIASFSNGIFLHEVGLWCPFWVSCLQGACCNHTGKLPKTKFKKKINYMATTTAIAARCRNPKMSAVSYRLSTILFHSGTKYDDLVRLSRFGICMHPQSVVLFEEKLGEKYDAKVQIWKKILKRTSRQYSYYKRRCKNRFVLHGQVTINIILCLKWKVHQKINYMQC